MLRVIIALFGLLAVVGILGGIKATQIFAMIEAEAAFVPPPEAVSTTEATSDRWAPKLEAVGTLVARQAVVVSTEVPGSVTRINFDSGDLVKRGKVLVELDTSVERAQLASAQAAAELADITLKRTRSLGSQQVSTEAAVDQAEAEAKRARAAVAQIRASIAKKTIRAPFSGKLGIRQVDLGEIVSPGTSLVSLQAIEELYADFYLPQREVERVREGQGLVVRTDAVKGRDWQGEVAAVEASVDVATRNILVRGAIKNEDRLLRPGMFVEIALELPAAAAEVVVVPETAILFAPYGNSVFIVEEGKARQILVEVGERRGDFIAVKGDLQAGAEVVKAGAFKLRDGVSVQVNNDQTLQPSLAPKPEDS